MFLIRFCLAFVVIVALFSSTFITNFQISAQNEVKSAPTKQNLKNSKAEFEPNVGQFDERVKFVARGNGQKTFLTNDEAVFVSKVQTAEGENKKAFALRMKYIGANADSEFVGLNEQTHKLNYFRGDDSSKWQTDVPTFSGVRQESVYDGVDVVWRGLSKDSLEYDFVVAPNAKRENIELEFDGASYLEVNENGDLLIHTENGVLRQAKPFTYQETNGLRQEVASGFELRGANRVGFAVGNYDKSQVLTIDPAVTYSTYLDGNVDFASIDDGCMTADSAGNAYTCGTTTSSDYPTTSGTFDTTYNSGEDIFITKINSDGSSLVYSTFLGGSVVEEAFDIKLDASNNVYIVGSTQSTNFPTTTGSFDTIQSGAADGFITKLNANGNALIYSTFLGAENTDIVNTIATDAAGNAYVAGRTNSNIALEPVIISNFPTTLGAYDTSHNGGGFDSFVTKINPTGTTLVYSTFLGGNDFEGPAAIAVKTDGTAVIAGTTDSPNFPTSTGAFSTTRGGTRDTYVTGINPAGTAVAFSTYIGGGSNFDSPVAIALDSSGAIVIAGRTGGTGTDFPTTPGAYDTTYNFSTDGYIAKLNPTATALIFSTYLGADRLDALIDMAMDSAGNIYVSGWTESPLFPLVNPTDAIYNDGSDINGNYDVFVSKLSPNGSQLLFSTFLGGLSFERGQGIAVQDVDKVIIGGATSSSNFPTTLNAYDPIYNGSGDAFVTKFNLAASVTAAATKVNGRVLSGKNRGLINANVILTDTQTGIQQTVKSNFRGNFTFENLPTGRFYTVTVSHLKYNFTPNDQSFQLFEDKSDLIFRGLR
ncbi:MAG: SBBP repeat-containing protein [Pyrinomonadaceae bacterium]|nr:SBBP repeat-containing protein [Pyrinomonadaceae bacterium]